MVEVASTLAGPLGAAAFLLAGVLATVSSANASILSSSRSVFALGRDGVVPETAGAVNERFRTPHVAILMAAVPMAALTLFGRLDLLAEVASLLHLVLYGLLCFALVALRRRRPETYEPAFRCPGYPWVPVAGGLASFGLIVLMQPLSQLVGAGILALAWLWHRLHDPESNPQESLA
jgi:amino acid transporter